LVANIIKPFFTTTKKQAKRKQRKHPSTHNNIHHTQQHPTTHEMTSATSNTSTTPSNDLTSNTFPLLNVPTKEFNFQLLNVPTKLNNVDSLIRVAHQKPDTMPEGYIPSDLDVCCGRGGHNWNLPGNVNFRKLIHAAVGPYLAAPRRNNKTAVVASVVVEIRRQGGHFFKERHGSDSPWYDIGDIAAREKVGHSLRDQTNNAASPVKKSRFAQQAKEERRRASLPSLSVHDLIKEATRRRASLPSSSVQLVKEATRHASLPSLAVQLFREETGRAADPAAIDCDCDSLGSAWGGQVETSLLPSLSPSSSFSSFSSFTEETTLDDFVPAVITPLSRVPTPGSFDISSVMWDTDLQPTDSSELLPFDDECHDYQAFNVPTPLQW
jgi:hypothetical protein